MSNYKDPKRGLFSRMATGSSAQTYSSRLKRKKKERIESASDAESSTRERHGRMLAIMTEARRALLDVSRTDLGERFKLSFAADDWQGWPRLTLRLVDTRDPHREYPSLRLRADDRLQQGIIEVVLGSSSDPIVISTADSQSPSRFGAVLSKVIGSFMDDVTDLVLEHDEDETLPIEEEFREMSFEEEAIKRPQEVDPLAEEELFLEGGLEDDFFERLPEMEEKTDSFPDLDSDSPEKKTEDS